MLTIILAWRVAHWFVQVDQPIPSCAAGSIVEVSTRLQTAKLIEKPRRRLILAVLVEQASARDNLVGRYLRLSWYTNEGWLQVGQCVRFLVKFRCPWGSANSGTFDYRQWLLSQEFSATGYIVKALDLDVVQAPEPTNISFPKGTIRALALGDRSCVTDQEWRLFRDTGTIHLMVVSGLHVGIFAGICGILISGLLLPVAGVFNFVARTQLVLSGAGLGVLSYAWMTGGNAPVMRAALTFLAVVLCLLSDRRQLPFKTLMLVVWCAVMAEPKQVLQQGFWLSYGAVAVLLFLFAYRLRPLTWLRAFLKCQIGLFVGLSPLLGYVVGGVPLLSMFANTLVVPLVSSITIPAAMVNVVADFVSMETLEIFSRYVVGVTMTMTKMLLSVFSPLKFGYFGWEQMLILFTCFLVLSLPLSARLRLMVLSCFLITTVKIPERIAPGEFLIRNLDVGQGSAAIIETRRHRLVVDAGPHFAGGFNAGESVVVPSLDFHGPSYLNAVVVSHRDNDHVGGLSALTERLPMAAYITDPATCIDGLSWNWDGVRFSLLRVEQRYGRNNASCTMLIEGRQAIAFLAGDIERAAQRKLYKRLPANVEFLLAPHHGSRTSSNHRFVNKLRPRWIVVSAGKDNRYGHPHPDVVARYHRAGSKIFSTAELGQITYRSWRSQLEGVRCGLDRVCLPLTGERTGEVD